VALVPLDFGSTQAHSLLPSTPVNRALDGNMVRTEVGCIAQADTNTERSRAIQLGVLIHTQLGLA